MTGSRRSRPRPSGLKCAPAPSSASLASRFQHASKSSISSARITRALGSNNIDHRLRQADFRDQAADPALPGLGLAIADVDKLDALLVVGSNLRREVPILAHRVRKAALRGAKVSFVNPARFEYLFPVAVPRVARRRSSWRELAAVYAAASTAPRAEHLAALVAGAQVTAAHRASPPR